MNTGADLETRKKTIRKISIIFAALILLLTFFSNTINNFLLPEVETVNIVEGRIVNTIEAVGVAEPIGTEKIYSVCDCRLDDVKVSANQKVTKGMVLAVVDQEERKREIALKSIELDNLRSDMEKYKNSYDLYSISALNELTQLKKEMEACEENLNLVRELFDAGNESKLNLSAAIANYEKSKSSYENLKNTIDFKKREFDLETGTMQNNIKLAESELDRLEKSIYANDEIICGFDGFVKEALFEKGDRIAEGQILFEIVPDTDTAAVTWNLIAEKGKLADIGDPVNFEAESPEKIRAEGTISKKEYIAASNEYRFTSVISLEEAELKNGLKLDVSIVKSSNVYGMVVPNSAIIKSAGQEYIYVLNETEGPLGEEIYAERVRVTIVDSNAFNSAINAVLDADSRVVSYSSKPLVLDKVQVKLR